MRGARRATERLRVKLAILVSILEGGETAATSNAPVTTMRNPTTKMIANPKKMPTQTFMAASPALVCALRVPPARGMARHLRSPFDLNRGVFDSCPVEQKLLNFPQQLPAPRLAGGADMHGR